VGALTGRSEDGERFFRCPVGPPAGFWAVEDDASLGLVEAEGSGAVVSVVDSGTGTTLGVSIIAMRPSSSFIGCAAGSVDTSIGAEK